MLWDQTSLGFGLRVSGAFRDEGFSMQLRSSAALLCTPTEGL